MCEREKQRQRMASRAAQHAMAQKAGGLARRAGSVAAVPGESRAKGSQGCMQVACLQAGESGMRVCMEKVGA